MRKWFVSVAGLTCLVVVIAATVVANAGASITAPETFTLVGSTQSSYLVDLGEPTRHRLNAGDVVFILSELTDENGENVGKARTQCTVQIGRWQICIETWHITGRGQIVGEGMRPPYAGLDTPPFDLAVTGGTGEFSNVRGTVHVETLDAAERVTFDLVP